jgi:biliverdin reductase
LTALILLLNLFKSPIILILIFAAVRSIFLQEAADAIFGDTQADFYKACLCNAQLRFPNGFVAESVYGKEEVFGHSENIFTIYGAEETLVFTPKSSINAGRKSAHYQSMNAARLVCSRYRYGVGIFVKRYAFIRE